MIVNLIIWLYTSAVCYLIGLLGFRLFRRLTGDNNQISEQLPIVIILGYALITTITTALSLIMKIGLAANTLIFLSALAYSIVDHRHLAAEVKNCITRLRTVKPAVIILFILIFVAVWILSTLPPYNPDTHGYHALTIKWIENYPTPPGLGNLYYRLAYNSSYFTSAALFGFSFVSGQSFHCLSELFLLITSIYLLKGLDGILKRDLSIVNWIKTLLLPVAIQFYAPLNVASPTADIPLTYFTWIVIIYFIEDLSEANGQLKKQSNPPYPPLLKGETRISPFEKGEKRYISPFEKGGQRGILSILQHTSKMKFDAKAMFVIALSLFLVTIKLAALPLLILVLIWLAKESYRLRLGNAIVIATLSVIVMGPWLGRCVILSGYLVYPFPGIDIFGFDWKMPIQKVITEYKTIQFYARLGDMTIDNPAARNIINWLPVWFANQTIVYKLLFIAVSTSVAAFAGYSLLRLKATFRGIKDNPRYYIAIAVSLTGYFYWLLTAPYFRFGYGFIFILLALLLAPLLTSASKAYCQRLNKKIKIIIAYVSAACILLFPALYINLEMKSLSLDQLKKASRFMDDIGKLPERAVLPADYMQYGTKIVRFNNFNAYMPIDFGTVALGYAPLPSTPYFDENVAMRGKDIEDGFKYIAR